ncbi:hypothetical protein [Ferruginivarius sediminum]|uniref:DUF2946 domain-containing protein n=1 Tax=Ferruginivarius sediminum TaxID=2661937 RepID=A0A369T9Q1_9PROT|nr:hypothetical protein [Ferruginivarius sediminum]RDD62043.1 hypothetical protein DRB17_09390 [Ferruginivarius sediminum]
MGDMRKIVALLTFALMLAVAAWPAAGNAHLAAHTSPEIHAVDDTGHTGPGAPASQHGDHSGHCVSGACWSFATPSLQMLHPELPIVQRDLGLNCEQLRGLTLENDPPVPRHA